MSVILLGLLAFVQPEDASVYYGMDMNIAQFSRYWEWVYETSPYGFRTSQGSHDMEHWYQIYEAKSEIAFARNFNLRYSFRALYDFDFSMYEHRFEPTMRAAPNLYLHLVVVPFYFKKENEAGIGLAWRRGSADWLAFYAIAQHLDHNLSIYFVPEGPDRDPYTRIPLKFEVDARRELRWARLRLHAELGTQSAQYLDWPDSNWYEWERDRDRSFAWGRLELQPLKNLWVGTRFSWRIDRIQTRWSAQDSLTADTVRDRYIKPFVSYSPTERLELLCTYQIWRMDRDMDSVSYRRNYDVLTALISWNPLPVFVFEAGYQRSWRYRYNDDTLIAEQTWPPWRAGHAQSRLLFNFEFRFRSGLMFTIKQGIEMDCFPEGTFSYPHNHTYVSIHMPLAFFDDHGRSKD
ncbi:hypothetical protein ES703_52189 [subsurface metagenome]